MGLLKRMFGSDLADETTVAAHGRVPIPGDAKLTLPAGTVRLTYQQRYINTSFLRLPGELKITIAGPGGEEIPIKRGMPSKAASESGGYARHRIGTITIPMAGEYAIHTEPDLSGAGGDAQAFVLFGD